MYSKHTSKYILNVFHYFLLLLAVYLFFTEKNTVYPLAIVLLFFIGILLIRTLFNLKDEYILMILLSSYLEILGEYFGGNLYQSLFYYDKFLHFANCAGLTYIFYNFSKGKGLSGYKWLFALLSTVGVGAIEELLEYSYDILFKPLIPMQGVFSLMGIALVSPFQDTMWDMFFNFFGAIFGLFIIYLIYRAYGKHNSK